MRISIVMIGAALIAATALSTPADALEQSQAIKLCKANPNCRVVYPGKNPGLCVRVGTDSCGHYVDCWKGKCTKIWIEAGGKRKPIRGDVGTVLTSAPDKLPKPVTGAGANVKTTGQQPIEVVRDHRSQPVVRDHRSQPIGRDRRMAGDHRGPVPNRK